MKAAYPAIIRLSFMDRIAFRADSVIAVMCAFARLFFAFALWSAIFDGRPSVAGFSLRQMTAYYLVCTFIYLIDQSEGYVWEFASEIRSGCFGKYLIRPVDPFKYFCSVCSGRTIFNAIAVTIGGCAALAVFPGALLVLKPENLLMAVPIVASGLFSLCLINFMTAMLAFKFQDITAFHMVKTNLIEFLSGLLLPLAILPEPVRFIIALTPFPALASLPAELLLGRGMEDVPRALVVLLLWNVVLYALARLAFKRLSVRYEEVGA